jgi:nuclear RNA export factor
MQPGGRPPQVWDKTLDAIHQAMTTTNSGTQANVRQAKAGGGPLEQVSVRGWKRSRAASNRDGGIESLLAFLERRLNASDSKSGPRAKITKVCAAQ